MSDADFEIIDEKPEPIRAILWDIGGPIINDEIVNPYYRKALIRAASETLNRQITEEAFDRVNHWAVESYAPFVFRAITFALVGKDAALFREAFPRFRELTSNVGDYLQPGIKDLLHELAPVFPMGVLANQKSGLLQRLEKLGIASCFKIILSAGDSSMYKPDTRFFSMAALQLNLKPEYCLMIGDRPDNDIVPAKMIGMRALRIRTGWHINQPIRDPQEQADWTVDSIQDLIDTVRKLCG